MRRAMTATAAIVAAALGGCDSAPPPPQKAIKVTSVEQQALHKLDALNLAIALKRAIHDSSQSCKRITNAGYVGTYRNLDMWAAHCVFENGAKRDWAVFVGPDGSAQVRDCKDVEASGAPACAITRRPEGSFDGR